MPQTASIDTERRFRSGVALFQQTPGKDDAALQRILDKIDEFDMNRNLLELNLQGYTVLKGVLSADKVDRAKAGILRRVERAGARKIDPHTATTDDFHGMAYQHYLLFDDPVFQEILMEPKPLALITYLLGESCVLSSMGCHFRGPGGMPLAVHCDGAGPMPLPAVSMVANCNYALTPYSRETGALMMFPGTHRKCRSPTPHENWMAGGETLADIAARDLSPADIDALDWTAPAGGVTMNLEPGDAVVWHGNSWHGGWRREASGVRMNLAAYFCRPMIATQERRGDTRYPEVFERYANEPRFAQLLGSQVYNGWREEGPDNSKAQLVPRGVFD
jgi:ectoine hydroxylase-related dioxygenase (phytanoyl-CoA dioxygenase family)